MHQVPVCRNVLVELYRINAPTTAQYIQAPIFSSPEPHLPYWRMSAIHLNSRNISTQFWDEASS